MIRSRLRYVRDNFSMIDATSWEIARGGFVFGDFVQVIPQNFESGYQKYGSVTWAHPASILSICREPSASFKRGSLHRCD